MRCSNTFWLENPYNLFCSMDIIPTDDMSNERQFNTITRLIFIISAVLYILNYKYTSLFILLALIVIISIYYVSKKKEHFQFPENQKNSFKNNQNNKEMSLQELRNYQNRIFRSDIGVTNDVRNATPRVGDKDLPQTQFFMELKESGPPLPRTLVKPIVVNPPYMNMPDGYNEPTTDNVIQRKIVFRNLTETDPVRESFEMERTNFRPNTKTLTTYNQDAPSFSPIDNTNPYFKGDQEIKGNDHMGIKEMPFACGYNAEKIKYGVPVNFPAAPMDLNDKMTDYNRKIFTNRYGDVVYNNEVQEINFIQNLQSDHYSHGPVSKRFDPATGTSYVTRHDPLSYKLEPTKLENPFDERPSLSNTFDGRSIGMGQEYRSYIDPVASTVNYMYDDIDTGIRGYNFISRNKIDIFPEAEQTGILNENGPHANIHQIVNQGFIDKTNQFRNDIIDGYIREFDPVEAQRKLYPVQSYYGRR